MIDYVKLSIIAAVSVVLFGSGWWMGYSKYLDYKKEVEIVAKTQATRDTACYGNNVFNNGTIFHAIQILDGMRLQKAAIQ